MTLPLAVDTSLLTALSVVAAVGAMIVVGLDAWLGRSLTSISGDLVTRSLALDSISRAGLQALSLQDLEQRDQRSAHLAGAIAAGDAGKVVDTLQGVRVYVLGRMVSESLKRLPDRGGLLQVAAIDEKEHRLLLPVFTEPTFLQAALAAQPAWADQSVIEIEGGDLLRSIEGDTWLVIDPFSQREFEVPPKVAPDSRDT